MFPEEMFEHLRQTGDNEFILDDGVYTMDTVKQEFRFETVKQFDGRKVDETELKRIFEL